MAPKKVMKVKKLGLEKLRKVMKAGKAKAKASSSKGALGKATSSKGALEKAKGKKLNKSNLEKFGQMSLKDKIAAACEEGDGLEAAAEILKGSLTKDEHSQVWGKHQTALKNASALEKAEHAGKSKKEKGLAAALWLLEREGKKYVTAQKKVKASELWKKQDKWSTEKEMLAKFSEEELSMHLRSGRVVWQEDPNTWGCFQYKDMADWSREIKTSRGKEWQHGCEFEGGAEDLEKFSQLYNQDASRLSTQDIADTPAKRGKTKMT